MLFCNSAKQLAENATKFIKIRELCYISIIKGWVSDKQSILQTKLKIWSLDYFEGDIINRGVEVSEISG